MVLGAFTVVSTLGILSGLPFNTQSTKKDYQFDINNNFYNYVFNNNLTETNFSTNIRIIIEYNTDTYYNQTLNLNLSNKLFNYDTFKFTQETKIDNYVIYNFTEGSLGNNSSNYIKILGPSTPSGVPAPIYSINQIYFGYKSSALSPIGGDNIIDSISSGLGLIDDITKQFGSGFGSLIWDTSKNQLTTFGNFVLIFLGVSITFAIIKLCLNLIRSKTGA